MKTTNQILKEVVSSKSGLSKEQFLRILGVDVENCYPILFNGFKYNKAEHENSLFLFLDPEYRIMGILKGTKYDIKKYNLYVYIRYDSLTKNRKCLTEKAEYILMITPSMQTWRPKDNSGKQDTAREKLHKRLKAYKAKKNEAISKEDMQNIINNIFNLLTQNIFTNNSELNEKLNTLCSFYDKDICMALREFSGIVSNYKKYLELFEKENFLEFKYYKNSFDSAKMEVMKWNKTLTA